MYRFHDPCELTGVRVYTAYTPFTRVLTTSGHPPGDERAIGRASSGTSRLRFSRWCATGADALPVAGNRSHDGRGGVVPRARYASAEGTDPVGRIVSHAGGFGVFGFVQFATSFRPEWLAVTDNAGLGLIGISLGFVGIFIEIWAVWHLRFSFATEPAARRLVKTGPYCSRCTPIYSGASSHASDS